LARVIPIRERRPAVRVSWPTTFCVDGSLSGIPLQLLCGVLYTYVRSNSTYRRLEPACSGFGGCSRCKRSDSLNKENPVSVATDTDGVGLAALIDAGVIHSPGALDGVPLDGQGDGQRLSTYSSFRELPRMTHISGAAIVALGLSTLILTLFEVQGNGLLWLFFYSIPANTAISVFPHEPVIVYSGQYFYPVVVALVALAGNLAAGYVDYHFFTPVLRMKFSAGYRKTRMYRRAIRWFELAPFWAVVVFALTPLPFYLIKFLVFSSGYSMSRYMLALAAGRLPRFLLLAWLGVLVNIPVAVMVAIFSAIFAAYILIIIRGSWRARLVRRNSVY